VDTKLFVPRRRRSPVARPRLSERLDGGAEARLTLISAPAGFGKTTSLAAWLAGTAGGADEPEQRAVAWVSPDEGDRQPGVFWTYPVTALQRAVPGLGRGVLPLLQYARPPVESVPAAVVNELGTLPRDLVLVLDDYHLVDGPDVAAGTALLLDHLPPRVHVVISTRVDTDLPLSRLCARGPGRGPRRRPPVHRRRGRRLPDRGRRPGSSRSVATWSSRASAPRPSPRSPAEPAVAASPGRPRSPAPRGRRRRAPSGGRGPGAVAAFGRTSSPGVPISHRQTRRSRPCPPTPS
jgi:hypothetical protein